MNVWKGNKDLAVLPHNLEYEKASIEGYWNEENVTKIYQNIGIDGVKTLDAMDAALAFLPKYAAPIIALQEFVLDKMNSETIESIRNFCLSKYEGKPWDLLRCTNASVTLSVAEHLGDGEGLLTTCRAISSSVQWIYNSYNIPGSRVSITHPILLSNGKMLPHAVNHVTFTTPDGYYLGYNFDAGLDPNKFYPNTMNTEKYHQEYGKAVPLNVGKKNIRYEFRPAKR